MGTIARAKSSLGVLEPRRLLRWFTGAWQRLARSFADSQTRLLWGILVLGALLRLSHLDLIEIDASGVNAVRRAEAIVFEAQPPSIGELTTEGYAEPPLLNYVLAIPRRLSADLRAIAGFIALLNLAALLGLYGVVRRYYGGRVALLASLLSAANPWAVLLARRIAVEGLLIPLGVLLLHGLLLGAHDGDPWGWFEAWLAAGVMLFLTLYAWPLWLAVALLTLFYSRRVSGLHILLAVGLTLLLFLPYYYHQTLNAFVDLRAFFARTPGAAACGLDALSAAADLHGGRGLGSLAGVSIGEWRVGEYPLALLGEAGTVLFGMALPGLAMLAVRTWARWREGQSPSVYTVPLVWLTVGLLFLASRPQGTAIERHVILWPAGFVAMAALLDHGVNALQQGSWPRIARFALPGALVLALLATVGWQAHSIARLYRFVAQADTNGGYGRPLRLWSQTARATERVAAAADVRNVWVLSEGTDLQRDTAPAVLRYLLPEKLALTFVGRGSTHGLLLPLGEPALYLLTRSDVPVEATLTRLGATQAALIARSPRDIVARVVTAPALTADDLVALIPTRNVWPLESGATLLGFDAPAEVARGESALLATYWTFGASRADPAFEGSHNLLAFLAADGAATVLHAEPFALAEDDWREDRFLVQWIELPIAPNLATGEHQLYLGLYGRDDLWPSPLLDAEGRLVSDWILLAHLLVLG